MTEVLYEHQDHNMAVKDINVPDPTNPQDTATKNYIDQQVKRQLLATLATSATKQAYHQQIPQIIASGVFTARDTVQYIQADFQAINNGAAFGLVFLYIGQNGGLINTPLYKGDGTAAAGVTNFQSIMALQFDYESQNRVGPLVRLTGLTVGAVYTFQWAGGEEGGSDLVNVGGNDAAFGDISPDDAVCWCSIFNSTQVIPVTIGFRPGWKYQGQISGSGPVKGFAGMPITVGTWPGTIKCSPNGQYVAVTNGFDGTVSLINAKTGSFIGTSAVVAAGKATGGLAWTQDSAIVWVGCSDGKVYPITPSLTAVPAIGAGVLVNAANDGIGSLCLSADGKTLYVADTTAIKVYQGNLTSNSVVVMSGNTTTLRAGTYTSQAGTLANCPTYAVIAAAVSLTVASFTMTVTVNDANKAHFDPGGGTVQVPVAAGYTPVTYTGYSLSGTVGTFTGCSCAAGTIASVAGNVVLDAGVWSGGVGYIDYIAKGASAYSKTYTLSPSQTVTGISITHDNIELWWAYSAKFGCIAVSDASQALAPGGAGSLGLSAILLTSDGYIVLPTTGNPSQMFVLNGGLLSLVQGGFPAQGLAMITAEGATP